MPRGYPYIHTFDGHTVGFSVSKLYDDTFIAQFKGPEGNRLKMDTKQTRINVAIETARLLIEKVFAPQPEPAEATVDWRTAEAKLKDRQVAANLRASTIAYNLKLIRILEGIAPDGPASVTKEKAEAWKERIMTTPGRRKKLPSAHYVTSLIGGMTALWQKWFIEELGIVEENPWAEVEPPKADKLPVQYATDEQIAHFYQWAGERFGTWPFPKLFLSVKAHTGCRLMDLCSLKAEQLRGGRLIFPANVTKGRKERSVPMPADLFATLDAFKGKEWLWENYLPGLRAALEAKGWPTHQIMEEFAPQRLYFWVETLFSDYQKANKDQPRLTSHMFRKRAFTMAWNEGIDVRHASIAYGCNVETIIQHYVALDEQKVTDDVFARMAQKKRGTIAEQMGDKPAPKQPTGD